MRSPRDGFLEKMALGEGVMEMGDLLVEQKFAAMTQFCVEGMVGGVLRTGVDQSPVLSPQQAAPGAGAVKAVRQLAETHRQAACATI